METRKNNNLCADKVDEAVIDKVIEACLESKETNLLTLFEAIRNRLQIPSFSNSYHALLPAVITVAYRNLGGNITEEEIIAAINRGAHIHEGLRTIGGTCGAALGVGVAFDALLKATKPDLTTTGKTMFITRELLPTVASCEGGCDCCEEALLCLKKAAEISRKHLDIALVV